MGLGVRLVATLLRQVAIIGLAVASVAAALGAAESRDFRVRGIFCNTEAQLDEVLRGVARKLSFSTAVALANRDSVVCNHIDQILYVVTDPHVIGMAPGTNPLTKYEGMLTGVVMGTVVRPVAPPARIFFVAPDPLAGVPVELRT